MNSESPVIVIGMHRSGTSLIARILLELGVHIGTRLDNHNESECFKQINQCLLQDADACWLDPSPFVSRLAKREFVQANAEKALELFTKWRDAFGWAETEQLWGWKDPRNTLTLPVWLELFPAARVIHVVRNGIDVAVSLRRRDLTSWLLSTVRMRRREHERLVSPTIVPAYRLWEEYVRIGLSLESLCASWLCLYYEDAVYQSQTLVDTLRHFLDIDVTDKFTASLGERIVREPKRRSLLNRMEARLWFKLGVIRPDLLVELGYESGEGI